MNAAVHLLDVIVMLCQISTLLAVRCMGNPSYTFTILDVVIQFSQQKKYEDEKS